MKILNNIFQFRLFRILVLSIAALWYSPLKGAELDMENMKPPKYLYKIISVEDWQKSRSQNTVKLSSLDHDFVHLATEEQLRGIIKKYWPEMDFIVLKLDVEKLPGKLKLEANPGGTNKYYHLYDGSIPINAVIESMPSNVPQ